ncbi:tetratricopeptide repeat protein [Kangiella marina]|uniref:histidine kinase n=1 Tax=Kangiella marina TaxID=1079178 RepID=A0ABP8IDF8_9GAMM
MWLMLCCFVLSFSSALYAASESSEANYDDYTEQQLLSALEQASPPERIDILLQLSVNNRNHQPQETLNYGQQALELLKKHPDSEQEILILSNMGWSHMILGDYESGVALAEKGVAIAEEVSDEKALIVPLNIAGLLYWRQGRYDEALTFYFRALEVTESLVDVSGKATTLNNIGLIYIERGDSPKAFQYFNQARLLHEAEGNKAKLSIAMNNIAGIHSAQSNYSDALEVQLEVLRIREELKDPPGIAEILLNIGITYDHIGNYEEAHEYYSRSIKIFSPLGDKRAIAQTLNATGLTYHHQKQYEQARVNFQKALDYAQQADDQAIASHVLIAIAELNISQKNPVEAQHYLDLAFQKIEQLGLRSLRAQAYFDQAEIYLLEGELDKALVQARSAFELAIELKEKAKQSSAQELLSRIYTARNDFQRALIAFKKYKTINDEIFSQNNSDKLAQLQSLYEAEKQAQQIELLERDKALQKAKIEQQRFERNVWIATLLLALVVALLLYGRFSQRKVNKALSNHLDIQRGLMQAVAHEFRAPLAKVQFAVDMLEESDNPNDKKLFDSIHKGTSQLDSLLKEIIELLKMESLKELEPLEPTLLDDLIREQIHSYQSFHPDKSVELVGSNGEQQFDLPRKHISWILSNLLSNAMHYSQSTVRISYSSSPKDLSIQVDDDGTGIPKKDRAKVFEPFVRLDPSRARTTGGTGLGLAIVQRLAQLYGAKVTISDSHLGGSSFILSWPRK